MIRVLIAEDQALLRGSLRVLVDAADDCAVVAEAEDGEEAVVQTRVWRPDVVLMDVRMPGMDGIEATRMICSAPDNTSKVLMLTTFDMDEYVYGALRAGASGFLLKDVMPPELLAGIRQVAAGESMLSPQVTRRLISHYVQLTDTPPPPRRQVDGLTGREREILKLVAQGLSNAEIAARLHLSLPTVKTHVGRLLSKCEVRDRTQLVIVAYQAGVVMP